MVSSHYWVRFVVLIWSEMRTVWFYTVKSSFVKMMCLKLAQPKQYSWTRLFKINMNRCINVENQHCFLCLILYSIFFFVNKSKLLLCFVIDKKKKKNCVHSWLLVVDCCLVTAVHDQLILVSFLCSRLSVCIPGGRCCTSAGENIWACLMPMGSTPCFHCVPGVGRQLKVQTETHSLML